MATKSTTVRLRATDEQRDRWYLAAGGERAFSEWARGNLDRAAAEFERAAGIRPPALPAPSSVPRVVIEKGIGGGTKTVSGACLHGPTVTCSNCA